MFKNAVFALLGIAGISLFGFSSCYYDNAEDLLSGNDCDTIDVSFSAEIVPLLTANCYICHSSSAYNIAGGGNLLEGYEAVADLADQGKLTGAVDHESGFAAMPPTGSLLPTCDRSVIRNWVQQGFPNN